MNYKFIDDTAIDNTSVYLHCYLLLRGGICSDKQIENRAKINKEKNAIDNPNATSVIACVLVS
jgi:hypothetical protein